MKLHDLAIKHGQIAKPAPEGSVYRAKHAAACVLHGWAYSEYHYGPVDLSDEDYLSALDAAKRGEIHAPASRKV
jgi:hypothetical protein